MSIACSISGGLFASMASKALGAGRFSATDNGAGLEPHTHHPARVRTAKLDVEVRRMYNGL